MGGGASSGAGAEPAAGSDGGGGDLLGLDAAPAPAPAIDATSVPVTNRIGIDPEKALSMPAAFAALTGRAAGVLYEDAYVQIGVKKQFTGAEGKVGLYVGNKCAVPLAAFKMRVPENPALKVTLGDVPSTVAAKSQVVVRTCCTRI
jgi:hypothetical protein